MSLHKLSIPLWLFSLWMRELELHQDHTSVHGLLWSLWEEVWLDVEAHMIDIAKQDPDAYVAILTDEDFVIDNLAGSEWRVVLEIATKVHQQIRLEAKFFEDTDEQSNKAFEVDSSAIVLSCLRRIISDYTKNYLPFD